MASVSPNDVSLLSPPLRHPFFTSNTITIQLSALEPICYRVSASTLRLSATSFPFLRRFDAGMQGTQAQCHPLAISQRRLIACSLGESQNTHCNPVRGRVLWYKTRPKMQAYGRGNKYVPISTLLNYDHPREHKVEQPFDRSEHVEIG